MLHLDLPEPASTTPSTTSGSKISELFVPPYARRTWMMVVFHFFRSWGYYGFGTLVPIVLAAKGFDIVKSLGFVSITFIGYPVGAALSLLIIERVERKYLVVGSALGMAVLGIIFGLFNAAWAILFFGFCYTAMSNVFSKAFHVYQAEIFRTRLRGTASSSTYSLSRLSSGLMPFILLPLFTHAGAGWLFAAVAAAMVIVAVDMTLVGPRTTGLSLSDVN